MPEIWLNYGKTDIVLDIRAENLDQQLDSQGKSLTDSQLAEKLDSLNLEKPIELVILNNSKSVQKTISTIFEKCEQKSVPKPRILADRTILTNVKSFLPEGSTISEFNDENLSNSSLVFVGEMELDGLFGFETIATRLIKKFGNDQMLTAYQQRKNDLPAPGEIVENMQTAKKFVDTFEILGIEITANQNGVSDLSIGHPSSTMTLSKQFLLLDAGANAEAKEKIMVQHAILGSIYYQTIFNVLVCLFDLITLFQQVFILFMGKY